VKETNESVVTSSEVTNNFAGLVTSWLWPTGRELHHADVGLGPRVMVQTMFATAFSIDSEVSSRINSFFSYGRFVSLTVLNKLYACAVNAIFY
jgi:hypothetical protein